VVDGRWQKLAATMHRERPTTNDQRRFERIEIPMAIATVKRKLDAGNYQLKDQVVSINRVTKVVKGGKNLSFAALVVVGDPSAAVVGYGAGKAKEVPQAIRKGIEAAKKNLVRVNINQTTIPHTVLGRFGSGMVLLKPAPEGTGVIAGGAVRAVMTSAGIQNVLTKSIGTTNPHNVVKATFDALKKLRDRQEVATMRGKTVQEM
jgi:small subunit ribosomal protein S5